MIFIHLLKDDYIYLYINIYLTKNKIILLFYKIKFIFL